MNTEALKKLFALKSGVNFTDVRNNQNFYKKQKPAIFNAWDTLDVLLMIIEDAEENFYYDSSAYDIKYQKNEFKKALSKI